MLPVCIAIRFELWSFGIHKIALLTPTIFDSSLHVVESVKLGRKSIFKILHVSSRMKSFPRLRACGPLARLQYKQQTIQSGYNCIDGTAKYFCVYRKIQFLGAQEITELTGVSLQILLVFITHTGKGTDLHLIELMLIIAPN